MSDKKNNAKLRILSKIDAIYCDKLLMMMIIIRMNKGYVVQFDSCQLTFQQSFFNICLYHDVFVCKSKFMKVIRAFCCLIK